MGGGATKCFSFTFTLQYKINYLSPDGSRIYRDRRKFGNAESNIIDGFHVNSVTEVKVCMWLNCNSILAK